MSSDAVMPEKDCIHFTPGHSYEDIKNSILLFPSISVANVPQLTADLLLHTLPFVRIGTINDDYLHSFVSPIDYVASELRPNGVSYGIELYYCQDQNLTLVQQRAPIIAGLHEEHIAEVIVPLLKQADFKNVILFHLLDAGLVENIFPGTLQVYTQEDQLSKSLEALRISEQGYQLLSSLPEIDAPYMKCLMKSLGEFVNYSILVAFAYEGDNFYDSLNMATKVAHLLDIDVSQWKTPVSWFGVYGDKPVSNAMEDGLYG